MFCIDNRCTDIYFNLAAEEYLLKKKKGDYFMLWQAAPSVVLGKHQSVDLEVNREYVDKHDIKIARRFSGGGAVYHDLGNINFTFIESALRPDFEYYLQQTIDFLGTMGIYAESDARLGIYLDNYKISGSAQCVHKDRVMYHCTLLFSTDLDALNASLCGNSDLEEMVPGSRNVRAVPSVRSEVTDIVQHLKSPIDVIRFLRLAFRYFLDSNDTNKIYRFTQEDLLAIEKLKREKYALEEWIHTKSVLKIL